MDLIITENGLKKRNKMQKFSVIQNVNKKKKSECAEKEAITSINSQIDRSIEFMTTSVDFLRYKTIL